mgnify:CR=1 FL=1
MLFRSKIPAAKLAAAAKKGGKLGQRARLAQTLKGMREEVEEINFSESELEHFNSFFPEASVAPTRPEVATGADSTTGAGVSTFVSATGAGVSTL